LSSSELAIPFGARVGGQLELNPQWKLRGAFHVAGLNRRTDCLCAERETQSFGFVEVGARYEHPSGFVAGLDVPMFAFDQVHDLVRGRTEGIELFPFPKSLAFSQIYGGYAWRF
jgi:hypothetical protein